MNVKKIVNIIILFVIGCICSGCQSTQSVSGQSIAEYQKRVDKLENTIRDYEKRFDDAADGIARYREQVEAIRERAASITNSIDRLSYLFDEYDSIVRRILAEEYYTPRENKDKK